MTWYSKYYLNQAAFRSILDPFKEVKCVWKLYQELEGTETLSKPPNARLQQEWLR